MRLARLRRLIRVEDVLLALWLGLALPVLAGGAAFQAGDDLMSFDGRSTVAGGLISLVAVVGALLCLGTRNRDEPALTFTGEATLRSWLPFPFVTGLAMVGSVALEDIGIGDSDVIFLVAFIVAMVAWVVPSRLPALPAVVRRGLITPFILVAGGIFVRFADSLDGMLVPGLLGAATEEERSLALLFAFFVIPASLLFYTMFVIAPRLIAESEGNGWTWMIRFMVFMGSVLTGLAWLRPFGL